MRPALVTLLPMLAAAGLVLFGGERLARKEVEERTPVDRERLLDFAGTFETELDRLDSLYRAHLDRVADGFGQDPDEVNEARARDITTIRAVHFFGYGKDHESLDLSRAGSGQRLPEVVLDGLQTPFNPRHAVILPAGLMKWSREGEHGWMATPSPALRIYWTRPDAVRLVAIVIDRNELLATTEAHLNGWMGGPLAPVLESGELITIDGPSGNALVSTASPDRGPAALVLPLRIELGDWTIRAWDRVAHSAAHHPATLTTAGAIAVLLALGGLFLYIQQRRALQLAEERVSFVNRVSHELGTPLTNAALNLDLATEALEARPAESRRRLAIVTEEIERLARLVANVLTFSRRERRALEIDPQPCTPDVVIGRILDSFRPALARRGIEIEWKANADRRVLLDPDALGQIVGNLVSNVEKYAASGGWLGLVSDQDDGALRIRVADRGSRDRSRPPREGLSTV